MHLPELIVDLALMLLTTGVVSIIFKKINQPLVLGYIVAGFLIGPYFTVFPSVTDTISITTWSEIGIIILMFYLGLDFNLHKLARVGGTAIITATVEVIGMLALGFAVGQIMGWSLLTSIFLGGMLSMSSTTIIIKAFDELKLRGQKFTELVFGTLVIEDIAGIFMMVILSTIAVSQNVSGGELSLSILLLLFYLALWLILGIYLLPTMLKKADKLMNDETLLLVSLGICFGMVLLADSLGFSSALGAFLAGSLLAGTVYAERVEHLTQGVRDLFGAVFFTSVGMMVDPALLLQYWLPILFITLVTLGGKLFFSTCGMLLSGQPLTNAVHCGFSLAQIGEFAFIIASLALSLGVADDFIYPIIVAVSVITTFTTPFFIASADKATRWLERRLPERAVDYLNRYTDENQSEKERDNDWEALIKRFFFTTFFYGVLMVGVLLLGLRILLPFLQAFLPLLPAQIITLTLIYAGIAVFIRPMLDRHNRYFISLWLKSRSFRLPLVALNALRTVLVIVIIMTPLNRLWGLHPLIIIPSAIVIVVLIARTRFFTTLYLQVQTHFLTNFNERRFRRDNNQISSGDWLDEQLSIFSFVVPPGAPYLGKDLATLDWAHIFAVNVVKIARHNKHINIPSGNDKLCKGDRVYLLGGPKQLQNIARALQLRDSQESTLRAFIAAQEEDDAQALFCLAIEVTKDMPCANIPIRYSGIRENWDCLLLGLQRNNFPVIQPNVNMKIIPGDLLWVLGSRKMVARLAQQDMLGVEDA